MLPCRSHRSGFPLRVSLLITSSLLWSSHAECDIATEVCDDAEASFAEFEASTQELYLLQKRAQVVRKSEIASSSADAASGAAKIATSASVANSAHTSHTESSKAVGAKASNVVTADARNVLESPLKAVARTAVPLGRSRSVSAIFVASANNKIVPLTHAQRLSMLSASETTDLNDFWTLVMIVACCVAIFLIGGGAIVMQTVETVYARIVREMVSAGLDFISRHILGVGVTFSTMEVMVFKGLVRITNVTVANPPGWKSKYFMNASVMEAHLNLRRLISSHMFGKKTNVDLAAIIFKDVTLNVEESESSSNIHDMKAILNGSMSVPDRRRSNGYNQAKASESSIRKLLIADIFASVPVLGRIAPVLHYKELSKSSASNAKRLRPMVSEILASIFDEATM